MMIVEYRENTASISDIENHLERVSVIFTPSLDTRVNIREYSAKIRDRAVTFEAWSDSVLIGFLAAYMNNENLVYITHISIDTAFQSRGIGSHLIKLAIEKSEDVGFNRIDLEVHKNNDMAISFYKRIGFEISAENETFYVMSRYNRKSDFMVSVCCVTYNHEKFIAQAIDSFLMQETTFDVEIVIGEDCSSDRTREICLAYKEKFPEKIKLLLPEKNIGASENFMATFNACGGKYIALCEGDDYWTDPLKLQKQIDFLEANPDYSMCFHAHNIVYEDGTMNTYKKECQLDTDYSAEELYLKWPLQTATVVFRKDLCSLDKDFAFDTVLFIMMADKGKVRGMKDCMSCYRKHGGGWTNDFSVERLSYNLKTLDRVDKYFNMKYHKVIRQGMASILIRFSRKCIGNDFWSGLKCLFKAVLYNKQLIFKFKTYKILSDLILYTVRKR